MIVPPNMEIIKKYADGLEEDIKKLDEKLKETTCERKISELQAEIRAKGLTLFGYQRTLNSIKYN